MKAEDRRETRGLMTILGALGLFFLVVNLALLAFMH